MRVFPILGVAIVGILIGGGLYYMENQPSQISYAPTSFLPPSSEHDISFRVLDTGTIAADAAGRKNYAAYSQSSLLKLWAMAHGTDGTVPPPVDFATEYVVGVFAGQRPTGGYSIAVTNVTDLSDTRTISVTLTKPGAGCITNQMVTSPYQIIAVPESSAALAHTDTETSTPCK